MVFVYQTIVLFLSVFFTQSIEQHLLTIYPEFLAQNNRANFEPNRWNGHNGMDVSQYFNPNHIIGSKGERWINGDLNNDVFTNATEDPQRPGYPDPNHFNNRTVQEKIGATFLNNLKGYQYSVPTVMTLNGRHWPKWMNTSQHGGVFPNDLNAGVELAAEMLNGLKQYTNGILPTLFEVINEPDSMWENVTWETMIEFHRLLANKLKSKYPFLRVGGPTYTGAIGLADNNDFTIWENIRDFLNMSLYNLDFFAFHPYSSFFSHDNSHYFSGTHEARWVGLVDLVQSYSYQQRGFYLPLVMSEYGLGQFEADSETSVDLVRWAYAYLNNAYMFTYLNHRDIIERPVAFILSHAVPNFVNASLFTPQGAETFVTTTYRFWQYFDENQKFLRVSSQYNSLERTVSSHAMADPFSKNVTVLLHNYEQTSVQVKLNFENNWINPTAGASTCILTDSNNIPHFLERQPVYLNHGLLTLPSEASCFVTFQTSYNFANSPTINQDRHYANLQAVAIDNLKVETTIRVARGVFHSAQLRFGVSNRDKQAVINPKHVYINGNSLTDHYNLFDASRSSAETLWDMFIYNVPTNFLRHGDNDIILLFNQNGGYVSSIALNVESISNDGRISG